MNFDDSFQKRVSIARNSIGLTQSELAKKVGVVPRQIAAYEGGEAKPREKVLHNLAAALGTTAEWLSSGKGDGPDTSNIKRTVTLREIPVLANVRAIYASDGQWATDGSAVDFIPSPVQVAGSTLFAMEIIGESMCSPSGISFPPGSIVTFDMSRNAQNGDFVLCVPDDSDDATFKQLVVENGEFYLRGLNPLYPMMRTVTPKLIAVAVHSQIFIKRNQPAHENEWSKAEGWDSPKPVDLEHHLTSRIEKIEEKLDSLIALLSNKKPT